MHKTHAKLFSVHVMGFICLLSMGRGTVDQKYLISLGGEMYKSCWAVLNKIALVFIPRHLDQGGPSLAKVSHSLHPEAHGH